MHNEDGQFGGCDIHNGGNAYALDSKVYNLICEVEDQSGRIKNLPQEKSLESCLLRDGLQEKIGTVAIFPEP